MSYRLIHADPARYMEEFSLGSLSAKLISASSLTEEQIRDLLDTDDTVSTSCARSVIACAKRILLAKERQEKVFVAGDYDADGITSTAIMKDLLDRLSIKNGYYIPDRFKEGYGLSAHTVEAVHAKGYSLIITVDNGVKCEEAIAKAHELGLEIIVTDHHTIEEELDWDMLVHPSVMEPEYAYLSGAGVALEISRNLLGDVPEHTALAAIALIGDVMPVWRENRKIIRSGFAAIRRGCLPSVSALLRKGATLDETAVAFQIVPKLNSVGRMSDLSNVNTLVPFLLCKDEARIAGYVRQLNQVNDARRRLSDATVRIAESHGNVQDPFPIIFDASFHEGVVGLAAGKLSREWQKPVLVFSKRDNLYKGSGRGIAGMNLYEFFRDFEELAAFGGHAQAVGLSVEAEQFEDFVAHVETKMAMLDVSVGETGEPVVEITDEDLSIPNIMEFETFRPFPRELVKLVGVPSPALKNAVSFDRVTKYQFEGECGSFEGVKFTSSRCEPEPAVPYLIGEPGLNRFRDRITAQIVIQAFSLSD